MGGGGSNSVQWIYFILFEWCGVCFFEGGDVKIGSRVGR